MKISDPNAHSLLQAWRIEFEKEVKWNNELMGWTSGADPLTQLYQLRFETPEQAIRYLRKHGFQNYEVSGFNEQRDFHGKKHYSHNFLAPAVENKVSWDFFPSSSSSSSSLLLLLSERNSSALQSSFGCEPTSISTRCP